MMMPRVKTCSRIFIHVCLALAVSSCSRMMDEYPFDFKKNFLDLVGINYLLRPINTVTGRVYLCPYNDTGNPDVIVTMRGLFETFTAVTNDRGEFSISGVRSGLYYLTVNKNGYMFDVDYDLIIISEKNPCNQTINTVKGCPPCNVSGRVVQCSLTGSGNPDVTVTLEDQYESHTVTSNGNGEFTFSGIRGGSYILRADKEGCRFDPGSRSIEVLTSDLTGLSITTLRACPPQTVTGRVVLCSLNDSGNPDVKVTLKDTATEETVTVNTNSNGEFAFTDVREGPYTLAAEKGGFEFEPASLAIDVGLDNINDAAFNSVITWDKKIGGSGWEKAYSVRQTNDCGYVVAGYSDSHDPGNLDGHIIKLNAYGTIEWEKHVGGGNTDVFYSASQTSDGGYIAAGYTYSYGAGVRDYWIVKFNSLGTLIWQKTYGGAAWDEARAIRPTADNGYIVAGYTESFGAGVSDFWALKLDVNGDAVWNKTYGGALTDEAYSIQETPDGGYVLCGITEVAGTGDNDVSIIKINSTGDVQWAKQYNKGINDEANDIQTTEDGGYVIAGYDGENPGQCWILKLNSSGDIEWDKRYGANYTDKAYSIQQTNDNGYIVAGYTYSFTTTDNDMLLIKLDQSGNLEWQKTFDDTEGDEDVAYSVRQTSDGGYIVAGYMTSYLNKTDTWLIKLNKSGEIVP